ncbi:MAG: phospholipase [Bacteroidota bacterium]
MHRHTKEVVSRGNPLETALKAMIFVHGRGATPESILGLADELEVSDFALLAPRASAQTWYPYSFLAPIPQNEPGLSTGLGVINQIVTDVVTAGISRSNLYFLGFSQGACLVSEYLARNAQIYGGAFIYSGGVIGPRVDKSNYGGDFGGTPILIGCSDIDAHIPLQRVKESTQVFEELGATVDEQIYSNGAHTIFMDEIQRTNRILTKGNPHGS